MCGWQTSEYPVEVAQDILCFPLAGVAKCVEHWPVNQTVTSSIPSQGTCLGCGPGPQLGAYEGQPHIDVSLPPFSL